MKVATVRQCKRMRAVLLCRGSGKQYKGGTYAVVDAPLDELPLFKMK